MHVLEFVLQNFFVLCAKYYWKNSTYIWEVAVSWRIWVFLAEEKKKFFEGGNFFFLSVSLSQTPFVSKVKKALFFYLIFKNVYSLLTFLPTWQVTHKQLGDYSKFSVGVWSVSVVQSVIHYSKSLFQNLHISYCSLSWVVLREIHWVSKVIIPQFW